MVTLSQLMSILADPCPSAVQSRFLVDGGVESEGYHERGMGPACRRAAPKTAGSVRTADGLRLRVVTTPEPAIVQLLDHFGRCPPRGTVAISPEGLKITANYVSASTVACEFLELSNSD